MSKTTPTPHSNRVLYFRLLGYVRPYWRAVALSLGATAILAMTEPLFPALLKPLLDHGFSREDSFSNPILIPIAIVLVFIVRGVFNYLSSYGFSWVSNRVVADIRGQMFGKMVHLPLPYFQSHASSVPLTKITYDVNGVATAATNVVVTVIKDGLIVAGLLSWLLWLNWHLTLICLALIPAIAWAIRTFSKRLRQASRSTQISTRNMVEVLQETAHCNRIIKVFGGEIHAEERFAKVNNEVRRQNMRWAAAAAAGTPLVHLFASIAIAVVVYIALVQSTIGTTTVGSFVSFITALLMLLAPLKRLADVNAPLQNGLAAAESIFELLDEETENSDSSPDAPKARGQLEFQNVSFRYANAEHDALSNVSFKAEAGQTIALVGQSGGGKSTLAALVPRFFSPAAGQILMDGIDLNTIGLRRLRRNIAYVSQDILLFNDTVAANIAYGDMRGTPREQIEAAAATANALEFIRALPEGFDTVIGEGGNRLSGGQRQRLAIARAILKSAPILILDEATSALDNESERMVQGALENLMQHRTTLVIAHRLSTIEKADKILVLAHGQIVESGTHTDLLTQEGAYAQLYRLQFAVNR